MYLEEKEILIKDVMLDIINPRFEKMFNYNQEELAAHLQSGIKSKELLTSMKSGLTWVNKIVVTDINELSGEENKIYKNYDKDFRKKYKYVVTEGNTRIACLLHPSMREVFDLNQKIPVAIARKSNGESEKEFLGQRKRLQSIANVMVVKDWDDIPKAKQLYESYLISRELNPMNAEKDIFKQLAENIGLSTASVKNLIYRYIFYKELVDNVEIVHEKDFKFFEIFEQSIKIRSTFGLDAKTNQFEWILAEGINDEDNAEVIEKKQELLYWFPKLIEIAKYKNINSKKLRDIIRFNCSDDFDNFYQKVKDVIEDFKNDKDSSSDFLEFFEIKKDKKQEENILKGNINKIIEILKSFPVNQDFSINFKQDIEEIKDLSDKLLRMFEVKK